MKKYARWLGLFLMMAALAGCAARSTATAGVSSAAGGGSAVSAQAALLPRKDQDTSKPEKRPLASSQPEEASKPEQPEKKSTTEDWMLILANDTHPIGDYEPELEEVQDIYRMDVRVAPIMRQMIADARAQGVELLVCSAYRPYSSQERNFNNSVNNYIAQGYSRDNAVAMTKRLIMEPGKSEHQTGLAADIVTPAYQGLDDGYANTAAAKWLLENAPSYGFILRYPLDKVEITKIYFEPWHYRYVGVEAAQEIQEKGLCLEEYLGELD